uniref:Uncharacterized protein n=1 Tax=Arundo donax TaxID=35708 RepID=A0A0A9HCD1_ARUDO
MSPSFLSIEMQRFLGDISSVIGSVGLIFDEEHAAASFVLRIMKGGVVILETMHILFIPEFGSNEIPAGSSQSRIGSIVPAVKFEVIVSLASSCAAREFESLSIFLLL